PQPAGGSDPRVGWPQRPPTTAVRSAAPEGAPVRATSRAASSTILAKTGPRMPGKPVRRRWALDLHGIRRIGTKDSGFSYQHSDGSLVVEEKTLARIRRIRVPPAWRDVRIARGDSSPLQAIGVDKRGRTQYLYHS